jgi:hypothetical protein
MPSTYREKDTLNQNNFLAKTNYGYLQAAKVPQPQAQIHNENDLIAYYKSFQKITIDQNYGDAISDSTIRLNGLYAHVFSFERYWNDTLEIQKNMIVMIDHSMYSFVYGHFKEAQNMAREERERFFSGIVIDNVDFEDQLTLPKQEQYYPSGILLGYIFRYAILAALAFAAVLWFLKKYHYVRLIRNILFWTLFACGAVCLFFYTLNCLFFYSNDLYPLLVPGIICPILGSVLRIIKIPDHQDD